MFQERPLELRFLAQKIAELFLIERAQADGCQGLRRMGHGLEPKRVQADEAPRQQEIEDLTAPVGQQLEGEGPTIVRREQLVGALFLPEDVRLGGTMRSLDLADWRNFRALTGTPE